MFLEGHNLKMNWLVFCFTAVGLCGAARAQSLPPLNASPASNHQVVVTWLYTNAGFTLQEAQSLASATNWQSSGLTPGFNSNSGAFSVSASTTNNTEFFRLQQPADPRGIYVNTPLGGGPNNPASAPYTNALGLPGVDGMLLTGQWSDLETN